MAVVVERRLHVRQLHLGQIDRIVRWLQRVDVQSAVALLSTDKYYWQSINLTAIPSFCFVCVVFVVSDAKISALVAFATFPLSLRRQNMP